MACDGLNECGVGLDGCCFVSGSEKLKEVLDLGDGTALEYKNHSTSMKDKSTFRNTKAYVFAAMGAEVYPKVGTHGSPCCALSLAAAIA